MAHNADRKLDSLPHQIGVIALPIYLQFSPNLIGLNFTSPEVHTTEKGSDKAGASRIAGKRPPGNCQSTGDTLNGQSLQICSRSFLVNQEFIFIEGLAHASSKQKKRPFPDQKAKAKKGQDLGPPTAAGILKLKRHPNPMPSSTAASLLLWIEDVDSS